ncbi:phosphatidate phosphatase PAH2-like [Rutidosis leptorrhynchoides]|uniref:phosphatidate phosphatase PAH2-like n=1 Tax=Rutidosis leptorrhynchoides TaxID=125765 RepID=UPI003A98D157
MYAVGRLSSYITRGVSTVSGPFHPFGGAIDIVVVQQQDGSLKSSPWYVRFGKFQGFLKAKEKVVDINVNGVEADFHMYLNPKGEAYFVRDDVDDSESKSSEYNFGKCSSLMDTNNGNSFSRTLGFVLDRKTLNVDTIDGSNTSLNEDGNSNVDRKSAEIAADLLEKNWSTNLDNKTNNNDMTVANVDSDGNVAIYETYGGMMENNNNLNEEGLKIGSEKSEEPVKVVEERVTEVSCIPQENASSTGSNEAKLGLKSNGQLEDDDSILTKEEPKVVVEERVMFSELDDKNPQVKVNHGSTSPNYGSGLDPCTFDHEIVKDYMEGVKGNIKKFPSDADIVKSYKLIEDEDEEEEVPRSKSLPNIWSHLDDSSYYTVDPKRTFSRWDMLRKDTSRIIREGDKLANMTSKNGDVSNVGEHSGRGWWPFTKSKSKKASHKEQVCKKESDMNIGSEVDAEKDPITKSIKSIKELTPTHEQLVSLNLTEGKNTVTFKFSTAVLGNQQVNARIFLWRWDTHIVISDVDGTITKSDVLGQFMPLVGKDWTHIGVTHLFSAIKDNGYEILFLSARSISQADITRQFLINLTQDGKTLPEGPVVISPDGLFPSLFREVIRRAPHEFKIACLAEIRACFPPEWNPFYAGFGNRDTDEFSYLKVGISKDKIFIINPKGEVVVNRCNDTKSYSSLHATVDGIFPPKSLNEAVKKPSESEHNEVDKPPNYVHEQVDEPPKSVHEDVDKPPKSEPPKSVHDEVDKPPNSVREVDKSPKSVHEEVDKPPKSVHDKPPKPKSVDGEVHKPPSFMHEEVDKTPKSVHEEVEKH